MNDVSRTHPGFLVSLDEIRRVFGEHFELTSDPTAPESGGEEYCQRICTYETSEMPQSSVTVSTYTGSAAWTAHMHVERRTFVTRDIPELGDAAYVISDLDTLCVRIGEAMAIELAYDGPNGGAKAVEKLITLARAALERLSA